MKRAPCQGLLNIIRFNWHFYAAATLAVITLISIQASLPETLQLFTKFGSISILATTFTSLVVSYYVYDFSDLYQFNTIPSIKGKINCNILNINAGFDESSTIIKARSPQAVLSICDFYDPKKHTEVSIKRARKAYPPHPDTTSVNTTQLPFKDNKFDQIIAIFSAHEIRSPQERIHFFKEIARTAKPTANIYLVEHLRDLNNFLAYNIGFLHFHSRKSWGNTFEEAQLQIKEEVKTTPFVTTFILQRHGNTD